MSNDDLTSWLQTACDCIRDDRCDDAIARLAAIVELETDNEANAVAHFLLGALASRAYWHEDAQPGVFRPYEAAIHERVIRHLTAFLDRPSVDGESPSLRLVTSQVFDDFLLRR